MVVEDVPQFPNDLPFIHIGSFAICIDLTFEWADLLDVLMPSKFIRMDVAIPKIQSPSKVQ